MIKKMIKRALRKRGLAINPIDEYTEKLQPVKDIWLRSMNFSSVVDVGASDGGFAKRTRTLFPETPIYSFEPIKDSFEKLNLNFRNDKNFFSFNLACSNKSEQKDFFISSNTGSSSLLEMALLHKEAYPESSSLSKITVKADKLDNVLTEKETGNIVFLKLDIQGAEILALEGAEELLKNVRMIKIEVSFAPLYHNQPLVNEIVSYLEKRGFVIAGIENVSQSLKDGTFLQADMFFKPKPT